MISVVFLILLQSFSGHMSAGGSLLVGTSTQPPVIQGAIVSPSASTIAASWQTATPASSAMACSTTNGGPYTISAVDNGVQASVLTHQQIVAGLNASTTYYCQITSANSSGSANSVLSTATTAVAATTPITGVSYGTITAGNSTSGCTMQGDTFYNATLANGTLAFTTDDTPNNLCGGVNQSSNMQMTKLIGTLPNANVATVNPLTAYGTETQLMPPDNLSPKNSGLFAMNGMLFMTVGRQLNTNSPQYQPGNPFYQSHGEIMWSPDNGQTWNNWQNPTVFTPTGALTSAGMFGASPSDFASAAFVMYCGDDGTLGYTQTCNRHDNGDAYIYLIANEGCWNNCSNYYIARVPRAKIANLSAADYQYFTGGNGNLDANWSATLANAQPILTAANQLSEPNVQYVPILNRYIMLGFYYPQFSTGNTAHTDWPTWEAPHPWGPWTLVNTQDWPTQGWYNPVVLNANGAFGTTPWVMFSGDFGAGGQPTYNLNYAVMTILH